MFFAPCCICESKTNDTGACTHDSRRSFRWHVLASRGVGYIHIGGKRCKKWQDGKINLHAETESVAEIAHQLRLFIDNPAREAEGAEDCEEEGQCEGAEGWQEAEANCQVHD